MDKRESRESGGSRDAPLAQAVGRTIKVLRTDRGLGRRQLAELARISYSYLTEIENGHKPASNTVLGPIADALGVRLHELIADAELRAVTMDSGDYDRSDSASPLPPTDSLQPLPAPWRQIGDAAPTSALLRRSLALESRPPLPFDRDRPSWSGVEPADGGRGGSVRRPSDGVLLELVDLFRALDPEDQQRVLDLARRLLG